ncbi:hypothetical protein T440DRAFT_542460 [Plenodomus tracheiphilus IPT5]|uniref:Uncharacterized protein n=1 Tax=Plenodomus tracheiphilus IPT5 TaxID=1408161 RepID=A0A6A7BHK0_9PLEO|nr:hypothetical protein T440DRAFT_542460 [Plenodomus tracheiphilus IPT5]
MSRILDQASDYDVHTGLWINRAYGSVYGATLKPRILSSSSNPDGLYHQRQVILRNAAPAHSAAWELLQVSVAWRGSRVRRKALRVLPVVGLSAVLSLAFTAADDALKLSSEMAWAYTVPRYSVVHVTSTSAREVLLSGRHRGTSVPVLDDSIAGAGGYADARLNIYRSKKYTEYLTYALQCYSNNSKSEKCRTYIKDTGYLMSDTDLGMTDGFKRNTTSSAGKEVVRYYYQVAPNATDLQPNFEGDFSFTCEVPTNNISKDSRLGDSEFQPLEGYKYGNSEAQISLLFSSSPASSSRTSFTQSTASEPVERVMHHPSATHRLSGIPAPLCIFNVLLMNQSVWALGRTHGNIPVTERGDVLGVLDVRDKKHPRLMHSQRFTGKVLGNRMQDLEKQPVATARPVVERDDGWVVREPSVTDSFLAKIQDTEVAVGSIGRNSKETQHRGSAQTINFRSCGSKGGAACEVGVALPGTRSLCDGELSYR